MSALPLNYPNFLRLWLTSPRRRRAMSALKLCRSHLKSTRASENKGHGSVSARRLKPKRVFAQMDPDGPRPSLRSSSTRSDEAARLLLCWWTSESLVYHCCHHLFLIPRIRAVRDVRSMIRGGSDPWLRSADKRPWQNQRLTIAYPEWSFRLSLAMKISVRIRLDRGIVESQGSRWGLFMIIHPNLTMVAIPIFLTVGRRSSGLRVKWVTHPEMVTLLVWRNSVWVTLILPIWFEDSSQHYLTWSKNWSE